MSILIFLLAWILLGVCVIAITGIPHRKQNVRPVLELLYLIATLPTILVGALIVLLAIEISRL